MIYITDNFTYVEMTESDTALRLEIPNVPTEAELVKIKALSANIFEPVRDHYGVPYCPNSVFRCRELEKVICAKAIVRWLLYHPTLTIEDYLDRKQHTKGEAGDIKLIGIDNYDLATWIVENLDFDDLLLEFYNPEKGRPGWVHVSYREGNNRRRVRTYDGSTMMNGLIK